jgi:hypothetical protein
MFNSFKETAAKMALLDNRDHRARVTRRVGRDRKVHRGLPETPEALANRVDRKAAHRDLWDHRVRRVNVVQMVSREDLDRCAYFYVHRYFLYLLSKYYARNALM